MKQKLSNFKADYLTIFLFCVVFCFLAGSLQAQSKKTFTSNGSWTVPAGVTSVKIEAIGGGGAGGFVNGGNGHELYQVTGGGGGGAYSAITLNVVQGDVISATVGAGGYTTATNEIVAGHYHDRVCVHGGNTVVKLNDAQVLVANGGKSVDGVNTREGADGGAASTGTGITSYKGGDGGSATDRCDGWLGRMSSGGGGGAGNPNGAGGDGGDGQCSANNGWGAGGTSAAPGGAGGKGTSDHNNVGGGSPEGGSGKNYGGGGAGSKTGVSSWYPGGRGAGGIVIITFEVSVICDATPGTISANQWVCTSSDTTLTLTTATSATSTVDGVYSWQRSTDNGTTWSVVADANAESYAATQAGMYRRGYTVPGCETVYSNATANIENPGNVNPGLISYNSSTTNMTQSLCKGSTNSYALTANTTYPNIVWRASADGTNWNTDLGEGSTYTYIFGDSTCYVKYFVKISETCEVPSNNVFKAEAYDNPVVDTIYVPTNLCPNQGEYSITAGITSSATIALYDWQGTTGTTDAAIVSQVGTNDNGHTYNVDLQVTDEHGCVSNFKPTSFTVAETVDPLFDDISIPAVTNTTCTQYLMPDSLTIQAALQAAFTGNNCSQASDFILVDISDMTSYEFGEDITSLKPTTVTGHYKHNRGYFSGNEEFSFSLSYFIPSEVAIVPAANPLCSGTTTTLSVDADNSPVSYLWNTGDDTEEITTTAVTNNGNMVDSTQYTVIVTNEDGCQTSDTIFVITTPSPVVANADLITECTPKAVSYNPTSVVSNNVPTGSNSDYTISTKYTWVVKSNTGVTGAQDNTTPVDSFATGSDLVNSTLDIQTVVYTVTPTTTTIKSESEYNVCTGETFEVSAAIKPSINNDGAITDFDDEDVVITLWYGACDTLYYVETPDFVNNFIYDVFQTGTVLSNDKGTANEGTLLGRIAPGEYSIVWKLTDPCGNFVTYTKKYIVRYPNCGENDPNYDTPFRAEDADGNIYETVRIGCDCWTKRNLESLTYSDNSAIPGVYNYVSDVYPNEADNVATFGRLYDWASVIKDGADNEFGHVQGICPEGWYLPTAEKFAELSAFGADALKSPDFWLDGGGSNTTGFTSLPAGYYDGSIDRYMNLMGEAYYWSTSKVDDEWTPVPCNIHYTCNQVIGADYMSGLGYSVRCIKEKDAETAPEPVFECGTSTIEDIDGNTYNTVKIGDQCWMKENLRTSTNTASTGNIYTPTTSGYDVNTYGRLYDWAAVMQGAESSESNPSGVQGICPAGWHVPSDAEWTQLTTYVGNQSEYQCGGSSVNIAKALASTTGWNSASIDCAVGNDLTANNATGFSALPAGYYYSTGNYSFGDATLFWSATQSDNGYAYCRFLYNFRAYVYSDYDYDHWYLGFSVRCLKD